MSRVLCALCALILLCANSPAQDLDQSIETLRLERDAVSDEVLEAIASIDRIEALTALIRCQELLVNPFNQARAIAVCSAFSGTSVESEALEHLAKLAKSRDDLVAEAAVRALTHYRSLGVAAIEECVKRSKSERTRAIAIGELLSLWAGPPRAERLELVLRHARVPESGRRATVVRYLGAVPQPVALDLYPTLFSNRKIGVENRTWLLHDLIRRPEAVAAPALAELLESSGDVRLEARALDLMLVRGIDAPIDWVRRQTRSASTDEMRFLASLMRHRIEPQSQVWLDLLASFARSSNAIEQRIAARLVLHLPQEERAALLEVILRRSKETGVRSEALRAVVRLRDPALLDVVIASLDSGDPRYRRRALRTLSQLCRKSHGADIPAWKEWWAEAREGYTLPPPDQNAGRFLYHRNFSLADRGLDFDSRPEGSFFDLPIESERVLFVLDASEEMARIVPLKLGEDIVRMTLHELAARHLEAALNDLGSKARVGLMTFGDGTQLWKAKLVSATQSNASGMLAHYRKTIPMGESRVYRAVQQSFTLDELDTVVFLSASDLGSSAVQDQKNLLADVRHWNRFRDLTFHTVSLFGEFDYLRNFAAETGGESSFAR